MPAGDGTGPEGRGPLTGRRAGYCAGFDVPGYAGPMPGRGFGMRRGRGRAWRQHYGYRAASPLGWMPWGGYAPAWSAPVPEQEVEFLKAQAAELQEQLDATNRRITELEQKE